MKGQRHTAFVTENGEVVPDSPRVFFEEFAGQKVEIRKLKGKRSIQLNNYYWGVVVEAFSDLTGYTPEEAHEILKARFFPKKLVAVKDASGTIRGEYVIGASTTELDNQEFMYDYCRQIREWMASFNPPCRIPLPWNEPDDIWPGPEAA